MSSPYEKYLLKKGIANTTINTYQQDLNRFLVWCEEQQIEPDFITYDELIQYIHLLREKGLTHGTIQHNYIAIRHHYNLLIQENQIDKNPITAIKLRGKQNKPIYQTLSIEKLEALYHDFDPDKQPDPIYAAREKATLGLMIFQAITPGELGKLTVQSIHLQKGSITVLGSRHRASRTIALQAQQMLGLYDYLHRVRPQLLSQHQLPEDDQKLLIHSFTQESDAVRYIITKLKKACPREAGEPNLINSKQLRASVIAHWIKQYNLREVQYLAGHHCIKSTEAYLVNSTEDLQSDIDKYHPSANK